MPRIYDSQSNPLDFHRRCLPSLEEAEALYANAGPGPDGRGNCFAYDEPEHPPYSDTDYTCVACGGELSDRDN